MNLTATWFGADQNQEIRFRRSSEAGPSTLMSSDESRLRKRLAEEWVSSANRLSDFDRLVDDWDGLGATAPAQDVVESAKLFLLIRRTQDLESPPSRVLAAPDGSVVFEWQSGSTIVEVEIDAPGRANYMLEEPDKSPRFWAEPFGNNERRAMDGRRPMAAAQTPGCNVGELAATLSCASLDRFIYRLVRGVPFRSERDAVGDAEWLLRKGAEWQR